MYFRDESDHDNFIRYRESVGIRRLDKILKFMVYLNKYKNLLSKFNRFYSEKFLELLKLEDLKKLDFGMYAANIEVIKKEIFKFMVIKEILQKSLKYKDILDNYKCDDSDSEFDLAFEIRKHNNDKYSYLLEKINKDMEELSNFDMDLVRELNLLLDILCRLYLSLSIDFYRSEAFDKYQFDKVKSVSQSNRADIIYSREELRFLKQDKYSKDAQRRSRAMMAIEHDLKSPIPGRHIWMKNSKLEGLCLISRFSGLSYIKNKNLHKSLQAVKGLEAKEYYNWLQNINISSEKYLALIKEKIENNKNSYLSGVFSSVAVDQQNLLSLIDKNLSNFENGRNFISDLNKLNINSIFIIDNGDEDSSVNEKIRPIFRRITYKSDKDKTIKTISLNILSLDDFCLLYGFSNLYNSLLRVDINRRKLNLNNILSFDKNYDDFNFYSRDPYLNFAGYFEIFADIKNAVFIFVNSNLSRIRSKLFENGIDINTGSKNKKGLLSPVEHELSLILYTLYGEKSYRNVVGSFNNTNKYIFNLSKKNNSNISVLDKNIVKNIKLCFIKYITDIENDIKLIFLKGFNYVLEDRLELECLRWLILNIIIFNKKVVYSKDSDNERSLLSDLSDEFGEFNSVSRINAGSTYLMMIWEDLNLIKEFPRGQFYFNIFINIIEKIKAKSLSENENENENENETENENENENKNKIIKLSNLIKTQKREYSTSACLFKNKIIHPYNGHTNSINNINIENIIDINKDKINKDSQLNAKNERFYEKLSEIIKNAKSNPMECQLKIEEEWLDVLKYDLENEQQILRSKIYKIYEVAKVASNSEYFKNKLKKSYGDLSCYLVNEKNILITLIEIVDRYKNSSRTSIARSIGISIMTNLFLNIVVKKGLFQNSKQLHNNVNNKISEIGLNDFIELIAYNAKPNVKFTDIIDLNSKYVQEYLDVKISQDLDQILEHKNCATNFLITIGIRFSELYTMSSNAVFVEISDIENGLNTESKFILSDEYKDLLDKFSSFMLRPKNLPMVCKPKKWDTNEYGGYLLNQRLRENVITGSINYHQHQYKNLKLLYNTINYFNSIQFGINISLLNFLEGDGSYLLPYGDEESLLNCNISLKIARIFENVPFYLNTHADWRGRIYTHSFYITYQGSDLSSALVQFWNGEKLTENGIKTFLAYGASIYSSENSRNNQDFKINWIINNKDKILNLDKEFLLNSETPYLFAGFCLEMKKLELNKNAEIKMPVFIDATCSGIQHIAALTADKELAKKVNLIPNLSNDKPEDIYYSLVEPLNKAINDYGIKNPDFSALSNLWLTRKDLKQPIMTLNYNVSIFGIKGQLFESLKVKEDSIENIESLKIKTKYKIIGKTKDNKPINLTNRDLLKIAMIIKQNIFIHYPALKHVYDYFLNVASVMKKFKIPIQWVTPNGAEITQNYTKREKTKLRLYSYNRSKTVIIQKATNKIDFAKQIDGIIPNVIHSLDSSHIIKLINDSASHVNFDIISVHDCFGTLPNFVELLFYRLKEEFVSLYTNQDFLKKFDKNIFKTIKDYYGNNVEITGRTVCLTITDSNYNKSKTIIDTIPTPPQKRDLDFNLIKYSKYMFK